MVEVESDAPPSVGDESSLNESLFRSERFWYAIDRQLLGFGLRLILILPAFSILTSFGSLAFSSNSPEWWAKIEPTLGMSFAMALTALTFIILLGYILVLIFHRHRVELSIGNFEKEVARLNREHLSVQSLHGYEGLADLLNNARAKHSWALSFGIMSSLLLSGIFVFDIASINGRILLLLSFSTLLLSLGQHIPTRSRPFNMDERTGLLKAYTPPIHPSTLEMVFHDLVKTHMDPLLRSEYEVYSKEIEAHFEKKIDPLFAREKILMTLYRHSKGLDFKTMESELSEVLTAKGMELVNNHPIFTMEEWLSILQHI